MENEKELEKKFKALGLVTNQSNQFVHNITSAQQTIFFGQKFINALPEIEILLMYGELGAGKTTFVKGVAEGIGVRNTITSPTFPIVNQYEGSKRYLIHLDLYRLDNYDDANLIFLQHEEDKPNNSLMIVEWPERLTIKLDDAWKINLSVCSQNIRKLTLKPPFE